MIRFFGALFLILLFAQVSIAQKFLQGYIIENGENKSGMISYSPSKNKKSVLLFKSNETNETRTLTANELEGFYLSSYDAHFLSIKENESGKNIFTEIAIKGPVTLSTLGTLHVLSKEDEMLQFHLPVGKTVYSSSDEIADKNLLEIKTVGAIKNFLSDCWQSNAGDLTGISISKLSNAVKKYNQCKGFTTNTKKTRIKPGVVLGVNTTLLTIHNTTRKFLPQYGFAIGASADFIPKEFHHKYMLNIQAIYFNNSIKEDSENGIEFTSKNLRFPISIKRFFQPGHHGFFVNPGVAPYVVLDYSNTGILSHRMLKPNQTFTSTVLLGVGWEGFVSPKHKLSITVRYEHDVVGSYSNFDSIQRYVNFQVAYSF
ncbi:MAG: hypothetical protein KF845_02385 [Cyclobacteriaceae bacterium]|nr:hypothetical protein [Cyclobacteriaceae bacterium]